MKALIDGDLIVYRVGFTVENEEEWIAIARANDTMRLILEETNCQDNYQVFISDSGNNFRLGLFPEYKANRTQPKPKHYGAIKKHLFEAWGAVLAHKQEADDALGINQDTDTVICSIDKDLYQIPGQHYNFVTKESRIVSPEEGIRHFYHQLLMGDRTDNIPGIYGIGPKKAQKLLAPCSTEEEMYETVVEAYLLAFKEQLDKPQILDMILRNGRLLKIRQQEGELWNPPQRQKEEVLSLSTIPMQEPCAEFMELMTLEIPK